MGSPIYDAMRPNNPPQNKGKLDLIKQYNSFKQDPFTFMLRNRGIDIPTEYRNDPKGAVQYLLNNGQMTTEQLEYMKSLAAQMGVPLN